MQLDYFWLATQVGILLEIVGALYIVLGSFRARRKIDFIFKGFEGLKELRNIRDILRNQARMELIGFLFLSSGLIMQFIGGFSL
jgi:uncharacterized membrane protein